MITGVFGLPGSGKTTFLTWIAKRALAGKKLQIGHLWAKSNLGEFRHYDHIFSSFPIVGCYKLDYDTIGSFQYEKCLILIDEMSHYQDCRDWQSYDKGKKYFFSMARHMCVDLIYCSQWYKDIDKKIQNMTAKLFYIEHGSFETSLIYPITRDVAIKGDIVGTYKLAPPIGRTRLHRRKLYGEFDSFDFARLPDVPLIPWKDETLTEDDSAFPPPPEFIPVPPSGLDWWMKRA